MIKKIIIKCAKVSIADWKSALNNQGRRLSMINSADIEDESQRLKDLNEKYKGDIFLISKEIGKPYSYCWKKLHNSRKSIRWTEDKEIQLSKLHDEFKGNFLKISQEIGIDSQTCYKKLCEMKKINNLWTKSDIEKLIDLDKKYKGDYKTISNEIGKPTHSIWKKLCTIRKKKTKPTQFKPLRKRKSSEWTEEDIKNLLDAIETHNKDWGKISKEIGRSQRQCIIKACKLENPSGRKPWTEEEKKQLLELKTKFKNKTWVFIAARMEGRTPSSCERCYHHFVKKNQKESI
jgi:hypothetical protein